jgi:hypothetical protein
MGWSRLRTLLLWVVIVALMLALWTQHERARVREARLKSALRISRNYANGVISNELDKPLDMPFDKGTTLAGLVSHIKCWTGWVVPERRFSGHLRVRRPGPLQNGLPIRVDPLALEETGVTMQTPITISSRGVPLKETLHDILSSLGLAYYVSQGLLVIGTKDDAEWLTQADRASDDPD